MLLDAARHAAARNAAAPADEPTLAREVFDAYAAPLAGPVMDPAALMALARHSEEVATVRAFQDRSSATRVVLLARRPARARRWSRPTPTPTSRSPRATSSPSSRPTPRSRRRPSRSRTSATRPPSAIHIDTDTGELAAPLGTVDHLASSTLALAKAFGGLTVATAEFATDDPELPITFAAREGEPVVLAAGDATYEL